MYDEVRNKTKLRDVHSDLQNVDIIEGNLLDVETLRQVVTDSKAVFVAVGPNGNKPGTTLNQDCITALIETLRHLRDSGKTMKLPRIVFLSSASIIDPLCKNMPHFVHQLILTAVSNQYDDLRVAERLLQSDKSWLPYTCINPGGFSEDAPKGHILSTEEQQTPIAIGDIAAGMIEVAGSNGDHWDCKNVSVLSKTKPRFEWWLIPVNLALGLLVHYFPWLYPYLT